MANIQHVVASFICLPCGQHHRVEVGLPVSAIFAFPQGTFEEVLDQLPEILEEIERDPFQNSVFRRFVHEHGQHDLRCLHTVIEHMSDLVKLRAQHFKKVIATYEQYRETQKALQELCTRAWRSSAKRSKPPSRTNLLGGRQDPL